MFRFDLATAGGAKLLSDAVLTPDDFRTIAKGAGLPIFFARKSGLITSRLCRRTEQVETRWNGKETVNTAYPFDHVVTNLDKTGKPMVDAEGHRNIYVITAGRFDTLYEPTSMPGVAEPVYRARTTVEVIHLPGGFEIIAPWGETQAADSGYLISNGQDVYGNHAETFEASYDREPAPHSEGVKAG